MKKDEKEFARILLEECGEEFLTKEELADLNITKITKREK